MIAKIGQINPHCFSLIDLKGGFNHLQIRNHHKAKTAFITQNGLYQYKRLPFGLRNGPAQFQRYLSGVLQPLIDDGNLLVYIDDIIVFTNDIHKHLTILQRLFDLLAANNIQVHPLKCTFLAKVVNYLGHTLSADGISPNQHNLDAITNLASPTNLKELQALLGLINYYNKFIDNKADKTKHMRKLLMTDTTFNWTTDMEQEFRILQSLLLQKPILAYPHLDLPFVIYTDASGHGLGWILTQNIDGTERIIKMGSKSLTSSERNASTIDRELMGILIAIRQCNYLLEGRNTIVYTDYRPLTYALKEQPCNARNARVIGLLLDYGLTIKYLPGKDNIVADALSRLVPKNLPILPVCNQPTITVDTDSINHITQHDCDMAISVYLAFDIPLLPLQSLIYVISHHTSFTPGLLQLLPQTDHPLFITAPSFLHGEGCLRTTLTNTTTFPISLHKGELIGQLILHKLEQPKLQTK